MAKQTPLRTTGSERIDEHGVNDKWDRGGVYDGAGNYDLAATQDLLRKRFESISERLPDVAGNFSRVEARNDYSARYESTARYTNENGIEVATCTVRIFPQGPYLNSWTVSICEHHAGYGMNERTGSASWLHRDARKEDSIGSAVATALGVMRQKISLRD